jgi:cytochrome c oxidase cbb3-type subunit III
MRRPKPLELALVAVACIATSFVGRSKVVVRTPIQQRGGQIYDQMCFVCHGRDGEGYKADEATALANPQFLASVSDSFLRAAIADGRTGTTMSAWSSVHGGPLGRGEVEAVIAFLKTWSTAPRPTLDETAPHGDVTRGTETFARECAKCHGAKGTGGPNVNIGSSQFLVSASNGYLHYAIHDGRTGTAMPAFGATLGDKGIDDVLSLLRSWKLEPAPLAHDPPARPPPLPLGPVPLNPHGPEPLGFKQTPGTTPADGIKAQLDRNAKMVLLDARAPSDYQREHIAGAVSVPFYDPDGYFSQLPRDAWLVCYCACPHAESGQLAKKLVDAGFTKVTVLDEGLGVWKKKGYGVKEGAAP